MLRRLLTTALAALTLAAPAASAAKSKAAPTKPAFSCAGAICVDAATGKVLAEENADVRHAPASVTKLMTLLVVLDSVEAGKIKLTDTVIADKEAKDMGGTQAHLDIGERHTVDELCYALMVQSANDAAVALAKHIAGSKETFVAKMNERAASLGLTGTAFQSPHGLPPSRRTGGEPDLTTARDLAKISIELLRKRDTLRFTSAKTYRFRPPTGDPKADAPGTLSHFINHNKLLGVFPGCDGLKTGWTNAGASIVTTASRGDKRVIAVVLGGVVPSADPKLPDPKLSQRRRDDRATKLMEEGLAALGASGLPPTGFTPGAAAPAAKAAPADAGPAPAPAPAPVSSGSAPAPAPAPAPAEKKAPAKPAKPGELSLSW